MPDLIKIPIDIDPIEISEKTPFLAQYFPNLFAEGLIPVNPRRWPAFVAGSAMGSDMKEVGDKLQTPFNNLVVAKEYLATAQSDVQWRDRFWKLTEDTFSINSACEMGEEVGSFGAGATSNKIADRYVDEMVETSFTLKKSEKLNQRIYQEFAQMMGEDP